jgi:hypothetical protein
VTVFTAYSADVISHLAADKPQLPFQTFQGLLHGTYDFGILPGSTAFTAFEVRRPTYFLSPPRRSRFEPGSGHVVDKEAPGQAFAEYSGFPCQALHRLLHTHHHPGLVQ